jgi:hypothetical protein
MRLFKVQFGKFAMILFCGLIIRAGGFLWSGEKSKMNQFAIEPDFRSVFIFVSPHAFEPHFVIMIFAAIALILPICASSQVLAKIIKPITISMIHLNTTRNICNHTVHKDHLLMLPSSYSARRIPSIRFSSSVGMPFPLIKKIIYIIINQCNHSFCKLDFFHPTSNTKCRQSDFSMIV